MENEGKTAGFYGTDGGALLHSGASVGSARQRPGLSGSFGGLPGCLCSGREMGKPVCSHLSAPGFGRTACFLRFCRRTGEDAGSNRRLSDWFPLPGGYLWGLCDPVRPQEGTGPLWTADHRHDSGARGLLCPGHNVFYVCHEDRFDRRSCSLRSAIFDF